jgi:4-hydroxybenzoate polyprenyltransferase
MNAGLLRLTRWPEHIPFTLPATLIGVNMAASSRAADLDWRLAAVSAANILAVTFAFMVNDIEDAPDDARDPTRAARNAVTHGEIAPWQGCIAALIVGLMALALFAAVNTRTLATGGLTLALGWLYSWRAVRLKAWPVIDVIAHLLMLSSLLFLAGYLAYDDAPGRVWWVAAGVGLISAYGQLHNQLRDYEMDRAAGLRNTASILGERLTRGAMVGCLGGAALTLALTVGWGLWPLGLALVPAAALPLLIRFRSERDMRGSTAIDAASSLQRGALIVANAMALVWLIVNVTY